MSYFGKPAEGPDAAPSVKQKAVDYNVTGFETFDVETGKTTVGEYDIEVTLKKISRRRRRKEISRLLQSFPSMAQRFMNEITKQLSQPSIWRNLPELQKQRREEKITNGRIKTFYNRIEKWGA